MRLEKKICVITGGTSGIGEATVKRFAEEGAYVVFCGRRKDRGEQLLKKIEKLRYPGQVRFLQCDISKQEQISELAEFTKSEFGNCNVLFNNAGIHQTGKIHQIDPEDWDTIMNVDVRGVYLCNYYFIPQMLEEEYGTIINMSSISGLLGDTQMAAYNTAKGAITNMTRSMAVDYAQDGIRVNSICPGAITTEILKNTFNSVDGAENRFNNSYPVHYIAKPIEVANLAVFLAARECDFLTGTNIPLDGGITAHTGQPDMGNY